MDEGEIEVKLASEQSCLLYRGFRLPPGRAACLSEKNLQLMNIVCVKTYSHNT